MAHQELHREGVVFLDPHLAARDLRVGPPAVHLVHKPHPKPQGLGHGVDPLRRLLGEVDGAGTVLPGDGPSALHRLPHKIVIHQAAVLSRRLGELGGQFFPLEGGGRVVLSRRIGRVPLGLGQVGGVVAAHLVSGPAGQPRLIVGGKPGVVPVRVHTPVIGKREGFLTALPQGGGGPLHPLGVVHLPGRRPRLLRGRRSRLPLGLCVFLGLRLDGCCVSPCARHGPDIRPHLADRRVRVDLLPGQLLQQGQGLRVPGNAGGLVAADLLAPGKHLHRLAGGGRYVVKIAGRFGPGPRRSRGEHPASGHFVVCVRDCLICKPGSRLRLCSGGICTSSPSSNRSNCSADSKIIQGVSQNLAHVQRLIRIDGPLQNRGYQGGEGFFCAL